MGSAAVRFKLLYVWFAVDRGRQRVLSFDVTASPTALWMSQRVRDVFRGTSIYRFPIHDNDAIFRSATTEVIGRRPRRDLPPRAGQHSAMDDARQTATSPLRFRILFCGPCGYEPRARELAAELQVRFGAEVEIEEGRFGQFDVLLDGKLVASKGGFWRRVTIHGAPPQERLLASIVKHLAVRDGDVCEIEPAHQAGRASRQAP